jgi:hypothetical protein
MPLSGGSLNRAAETQESIKTYLTIIQSYDQPTGTKKGRFPIKGSGHH